MRQVFCAVLCVLFLVGEAGAGAAAEADFAWPAATSVQKPWTYWWWMGSAVDEENLTHVITAYRDAGMGGMHIVPIYGVKGWENRYRGYLSPQWMAALAHTVKEARRLGLDVDMTTGTGWPFGGPHITEADAAKKVVLKRYPVAADGKIGKRIDRGTIAGVVAADQDGRTVELTDRVGPDGTLAWQAPAGTWTVYAVCFTGTGQNVKRAAPGAAGKVVDPFSRSALAAYLSRFDKAFAAYAGEPPRAHYHDSYEYYGTSWTPELFEGFKARRGYDLRQELPALCGDGPDDRVARVKADYRETIGDLLLEEFIQPWVAWCHDKGSLTRNQAHGSPGNILDLYAAADIPETEIFGPSGFLIRGLRIDKDFSNEPPDLVMLKFASSAAHVGGRRLVGAESCTWLGEHFKVALSQVKPEIDQLFAAGINHIIYHGMAYSPRKAPWPGWLFYASTNFAPSNPFYKDFAELNAYIARCQSILQAGRPAHDVLLYFPMHDVWHNPQGTTIALGVHSIGRWLHGTPVYETAKTLYDRGYTFDFVSDRLLSKARCTDGSIHAGDGRYRALVVPRVGHMPVATARTIAALARGGAEVIILDELPNDVPGWGNLQERRANLRSAWSADRLRIGKELEPLLTACGVSREPVVDAGIVFDRRAHDEGHHYFFANLGAEDVDSWVTLGTKPQSAVILDPRRAGRTGVAAVRRTGNETQVYLQLASGESCILRTFTSRAVGARRWRYLGPIDAASGGTSPSIVVLGPSAHDRTLRIADVSSQIGSHDRKASCLVDGSGLNVRGADTHSTRPNGTMWLSAKGKTTDQQVTFHLGTPHDLTGVRVWNYNENEKDPLMARGAEDVAVMTSADGTSFTAVTRGTLKRAPGVDDVAFAQTIPIEAAGVRFVRLAIHSNWGDPEYVGLSEVRFTGTSTAPAPKEQNALQWRVTFLEGGPALPPPFTTRSLASWTTLGGPEARRFSGTARYAVAFELPPERSDDWLLDLGRVGESARVEINGKPVCTLWSFPFVVSVGEFLRPGKNELTVEVTNLAANRIADMDRRGVEWKRFHEINFVNIRYRPFDASKWPPMPSGLLGPVRLVPARIIPDEKLSKVVPQE